MTLKPAEQGASTTTVLIFNDAAEKFRSALAPSFPGVDFLCAPTRDEALRLAHKADVLMAYAQQIDDELVAAAPGLKWIQALTTGTDAITALTTLGREVVVTSARGVHGPQMAELAFMYMLALSRNLPRMLDNQKNAAWEVWPQPLLWQKTVTILGVGAITEALAQRCKAFGMTVLGISSADRQVDGIDRMYPRERMKEAVSLADYFIVLVPHAKATDKIVNADVLASMKPQAYLINIARGGVMDEAALLDVLQRKAIAGAGLDVFQVEPLPAAHPFWSLDNVLITPHLGGYSAVYAEQVMPVLRNNLGHFLDGTPDKMMNIVTI
ncbi:MAG: D-2-hydroxyacid dehydrogenase [Pseudomonadota bacterium]